MKGLSQGVELLHFAKDQGDSEWYIVQLAINGVPSVMFSVPTPVIHDYLRSLDGERFLGEYLERQARNLIERYGDARNPRPDPALLEQQGVSNG